MLGGSSIWGNNGILWENSAYFNQEVLQITMELTTLLENAARLKQQLDALRPLDAETEQRVLQKFRLDWNYHSNHIEGSQLSFGETKALILFGMTAQGKPLQDHLEMSGHDEAIKWVEDVVKNDYPLNETFIRQLHEIILVKGSYKKAQTPNGDVVERLIKVGSYKEVPNHVKTKTGEIFYFASVEETPALMGALMDWYGKKKNNPDTNPLLFAAEFHYRFIRIHPFDDGNGRLARLLMNCILMQYGYPPVIVKTEDKENYYAALRQADAGMMAHFLAYIIQNSIASLSLMLKGAKGESIEEPDDIDKAIALLEQKINHVGDKIETVKSKEVLEAFTSKNLPMVVATFIQQHEKLAKFYVDSSYSLGHFKNVVGEDRFGNLSIDEYGEIETYPQQINTPFISTNIEQQLTIVLETSMRYLQSESPKSKNTIVLNCQFNTFNRTGIPAFDYQQSLQIKFEKTHCVLQNTTGGTYSVLYHQDIETDRVIPLLKQDIKAHLQYIQEQLENSAS